MTGSNLSSILRGGRLLLLAAMLVAPGFALAQDDSGGGFVDDGSSSANDDDDGGGGRSHRAVSVAGTHVVAQGDTLWDISEHYLGDGFAWPKLWSYNPEITNPHWIYPGDTVRINPDARDVASGGNDTSARVTQAARVIRNSAEGGTVFLREQGYLDREALEDAGEVLAAETDHMFFNQYDEAFVQFRSNRSAALRPGDELTLFRAVPPFDAAESADGTVVRIFGTVRVEAYDNDRKRARVTVLETLDPVERGMRVAELPRRFLQAPVRRNTRAGTGKIVAALRPTRVVGEGNVVFVNLGGDDGVAVGNRMFVVSDRDRWVVSSHDGSMDTGAEIHASSEPSDLPDTVLAELRIISVRPHSATAFVTNSNHEIGMGDRVVMQQGY